MSWAATAAAVLGAGASYVQSKEAKDLEEEKKKKEEQATKSAGKKAGKLALADSQGALQSSFQGVYAPGSKTTLG